MHEIIRRATVFAGLVAMAIPAGGQQRGAAGRTEIIGSVMEYRLHWIGDSTRFDACAVYRVAGRPADFPAGIKAPIQQLLNRRSEPCGGTAGSGFPRTTRRIVLVDSIATRDSVSLVYLTVHRGERTHRENYTVRASPGGRGAHVQTVTLWGAIQVHSPHRPASPASRPR